jgi:hypothetical protein
MSANLSERNPDIRRTALNSLIPPRLQLSQWFEPNIHLMTAATMISA